MNNKEAIEEIKSMGLIIDGMINRTRRKSWHFYPKKKKKRKGYYLGKGFGYFGRR